MILKRFLFFILTFSLWSPVSDLQSLQAKQPDPDYPLGNARLAVQSLSFIQRYYLDPARIHPDAMFETALNQIQKTVPEISVQCEKKRFCTVRVHQAAKRFPYPGKDISNLATAFRNIFLFMETYVDKDTDKQEIEFAAIDGFLNELDPHSNFMSPESYREFRVGTEGEFGGLGIVINLKDGQLTVTAPLEGTPAWKAGVKAGDRIIQINDESTINMTLTEAVSRLRGPVGTKVALKIERGGRSTPMSLSLRRAVINIEAVQSQVVQTPQGHPVGFLRVKSFQANTDQEFYERLKNLLKPENRLKGIVLDLRNNPGGLMDQAMTLADAFLKEGTIVSTVGAGGKLIDRKKARVDGIEPDLPLIVLVNEGSASASEIVAGALKNNNRALVVGAKTFGKGSVQSVYELAMDAALKLTVAQYLTPGNQSIQSVGISPDIELMPVIVDKTHLDTIENILMSEKDLEKHLDRAEQSQTDLPVYKLGFLAPAPKDEEEQEYRPELNLEKDTAARTAVSLMDSLSGADRTQMLEEVKKPLQTMQAAQDKKIAAAFQKLGIDWSVGEAKKTSQAELSFHLFKDGNPVERAVAGETVMLKIGIKNVGETPFHQLRAQSEAKESLLKNMEFAFGTVQPGETKTWETPLKVPLSALTEEIPLKLKFQEALGHNPPDVEMILPLKGLKRPRFAHQFHLEGDPKPLPTSQTIDLAVKVFNQGEGHSKSPIVAIKNLGDKAIFIEKGRVALSNLEPGKSAVAVLKFHIDPAWKGSSFPMELTITDADLAVYSKQELTFDRTEGKTTPAEGILYSPPAITLAAQEMITDKNPFLLKGTVKDDQNVRDLSVFVEDDKSFYEANAKGEPTFEFEAPLALKKGNNVIAVTARDNFNLISRQFVVIQYNPSLAEDIASQED